MKTEPVSGHGGQALNTTLAVAVPMWQEDFRGVPLETLMEEAQGLAQTIGEKGDVILFKSSKKGETAKAFNALARAIAILSMMPGGVTVFGVHYEVGGDENE